MAPIHYIIAVFLGSRANKHLTACLNNDPLYLIKMHIKSFTLLKLDHIKRVTFVISPSGNEDRDNFALDFIESQKPLFSNFELSGFISETNHFWSYGSWNSCMAKNIHRNENFFLTEDDYFPACDYFYLPFSEKMSNDIAHVPQIYGRHENSPHKSTKQKVHASMSGGLMNVNAAKRHYDTYGNCINLPPRAEKMGSSGAFVQLHFLDNFEKIGYRIVDLYEEYQHPYSGAKNDVKSHGNMEGEILLRPYINSLDLV